jgi:hypothetical protein
MDFKYHSKDMNKYFLNSQKFCIIPFTLNLFSILLASYGFILT